MGRRTPAERSRQPLGGGGPERVAADVPPGAGLVRVALWALPAYALVCLWRAARVTPTRVDEPAEWAAWVTSGGYRWFQVVAGFGGTLLGLIAIIALAALLARARRGRRLAVAGLFAGLAAATLELAHLGVAAFVAPVLGEQIRAGDPTAARTYERAYGMGESLPAGPAETLTRLGIDGPLVHGGLWLLAAALLVSVAWFLFGLAVWRGLSRGDGLLILVAAPLLGILGGFLVLAVPLGALLLAAAGIGIAWTGGRSRDRQWPRLPAAPRPGQNRQRA